MDKSVDTAAVPTIPILLKISPELFRRADLGTVAPPCSYEGCRGVAEHDGNPWATRGYLGAS